MDTHTTQAHNPQRGRLPFETDNLVCQLSPKKRPGRFFLGMTRNQVDGDTVATQDSTDCHPAKLRSCQALSCSFSAGQQSCTPSQPPFPGHLKGSGPTPMSISLAPVLISEIPKISVQPTNMSSRLLLFSSLLPARFCFYDSSGM